MDDLKQLATLIEQRTIIDNEIARIISRPAQIGHAGEYIAAKIFDITLHPSATHRGSDGHFASGNLKGRTVNIKWYAKHENMLDLSEKHFPDYYLILAGPRSPAISSRGMTRPWVIEHVFLFEAQALFKALRLRGVKIGIATSMTAAMYVDSEIYPVQRNQQILLTDEQKRQLRLFSGKK